MNGEMNLLNVACFLAFSILAVDSSGKLWVVIYRMERSKDRAEHPNANLVQRGQTRRKRYFPMWQLHCFIVFLPLKSF